MCAGIVLRDAMISESAQQNHGIYNIRTIARHIYWVHSGTRHNSGVATIGDYDRQVEAYPYYAAPIKSRHAKPNPRTHSTCSRTLVHGLIVIIHKRRMQQPLQPMGFLPSIIAQPVCASYNDVKIEARRQTRVPPKLRVVFWESTNST